MEIQSLSILTPWVVAFSTAIATVLGISLKLREALKEILLLKRAVANHLVLIGVIGAIPQALEGLPVFSDTKAALKGGFGKCIVIFGHNKLSYALQQCAFVSADFESDSKIYPPTSDFWHSLAVGRIDEKASF